VELPKSKAVRNILIIDDDLGVVEYLTEMLKYRGYKVHKDIFRF